jgi:hypothetical protein
MSEGTRRVEGARRATVLRYGGSLWVNGYWPDTVLSIEVRAVRRTRHRVVVVGPPSDGRQSETLELGASVGPEAFAYSLADWLETPSLHVRRAEHGWMAAARAVAADLRGGAQEGIPA